ncbi:hypothetical protein D3C73_1100330 [compost metagenome]
MATVIFLGKVDQNGVRVRQHHAVVVDHWHLAKAVERKKLRSLVRALHQIHEYQFGRHPKQGQRQFNAVGVTGQRVTVKHDRFLGHDVLLVGILRARHGDRGDGAILHRWLEQRNPQLLQSSISFLEMVGVPVGASLLAMR